MNQVMTYHMVAAASTIRAFTHMNVYLYFKSSKLIPKQSWLLYGGAQPPLTLKSRSTEPSRRCNFFLGGRCMMKESFLVSVPTYTRSYTYFDWKGNHTPLEVGPSCACWLHPRVKSAL